MAGGVFDDTLRSHSPVRRRYWHLRVSAVGDSVESSGGAQQGDSVNSPERGHVLSIKCLRIAPVSNLRFHRPLIKPDVRYSRIRLSDRVSCVRPREARRELCKTQEFQFLMEILVRVACGSLTRRLVFTAEPLAEPFAHMCIDRSVGLTDWS